MLLRLSDVEVTRCPDICCLLVCLQVLQHHDAGYSCSPLFSLVSFSALFFFPCLSLVVLFLSRLCSLGSSLVLSLSCCPSSFLVLFFFCLVLFVACLFSVVLFLFLLFCFFLFPPPLPSLSLASLLIGVTTTLHLCTWIQPSHGVSASAPFFPRVGALSCCPMDGRSFDCLALGAMCTVCMALQRQKAKGNESTR